LRHLLHPVRVKAAQGTYCLKGFLRDQEQHHNKGKRLLKLRLQLDQKPAMKNSLVLIHHQQVAVSLLLKPPVYLVIRDFLVVIAY
jgi:hypothetical protein